MKKYIAFIFINFLLSCEGRIPYDLKDDYFIEYGPTGYLSILKNKSLLLNCDVIRINTNSDFIITEIKPIDTLLKIMEIKKISNYEKRKEFIKKK